MGTDIPPMLEGHVGWILGPDGRTPEVVALMEAMAWMNEHGTVHVALDDGQWGEVSTVFVPRFERDGIRPSLFETQARGPARWRRTQLSVTYEEALATHGAEVARLSGAAPAGTRQ